MIFQENQIFDECDLFNNLLEKRLAFDTWGNFIQNFQIALLCDKFSVEFSSKIKDFAIDIYIPFQKFKGSIKAEIFDLMH
jgi:hypothetical protein